MPVKRLYVPMKDLSYDAGAFANDKLLVARNVLPWHGTYVLSPGHSGTDISGSTGNQSAIYGAASFRLGYAARTFIVLGDGTDTHIFEDDGTTITDRTDSGGYAALTGEFATFAQFGDNIVCTLGDLEDVQYLANGAADFAPMIASTFAPRAFFAAPIRGNLFLANLYLAAPYDTLAAGNHTTVVAWSQTDNITQFGSATVDPQLVGAGFAQLTNDGGDITGLIGGDYGIIFQERAIVRVDGPPYSFATIEHGVGCVNPRSAFKWRNDVYFWSTHGPAVIRDGQRVEPLLKGSLARALSEFSAAPFDEWPSDWMFPSTLYSPSGWIDSFHGLLGWCYYTRDSLGSPAWNLLVYNTEEQRASLVSLLDVTAEETVVIPGREAFVVLPEELQALDGPLAGSRWYYLPTGGGSDAPIRSVFATDTAQNHSGRLYTSFLRLDPYENSRVSRVRPVYRGTNLPGTYTPLSQPPMWVQVASVQNPGAGSFDSDWYNTTDENGWLTIPPGGPAGSVLADFHSVRIRFGTTSKPPNESSVLATDIREFDGIEIEYETSGVQAR